MGEKRMIKSGKVGHELRKTLDGQWVLEAREKKSCEGRGKAEMKSRYGIVETVDVLKHKPDISIRASEILRMGHKWGAQDMIRR